MRNLDLNALNVAKGLQLPLSPGDMAQMFGTGLSQSARLIEIETAQGSGLPDSLAVDRFYGTEGVNQLFNFEVDCLSVSTHVDLAQFIGEEITLRVLLPTGGKRSWHGYCTQAAWLGADGGMARYRLSLSPFLALMALRHDAFIFQGKDALGICEELFKDYPQAHVRYEVTQPLAMRAICTQYGESDLAFMTRLLADEGLSWRFEHEQSDSSGSSRNKSASSPSNTGASSYQNSSDSGGSGSSTNKPAHARHCLVIFDAASSLSQWPAVSTLGAPAAIRFHRTHAAETSDSVTAFTASRQASANAVALSAWDSTQLLAPSAEASSALDAGALPQLAVYEGAGQRRYLDAASASRIAELRLQALELTNKTFTATSSARHVGAGCTFSLTQHEHYPESGGSNQFKVLRVTHAGANNLPAQVAQLLQSVGFQAKSGNHSGIKSASGARNTGASSSQKHSDQQQRETDPDSLSDLPRGTYRNRFQAVRAVVPVVPAGINAPLTATAPGPQTAIVVGLAGEQLTTERNHSFKVQFAWQRVKMTRAKTENQTDNDFAIWFFSCWQIRIARHMYDSVTGAIHTPCR